MGTGVSAAGCLDDVGSGDDSVDQYNQAASLLEENGETLDSFAENDELPDEFDEAGVHRRVDEAEDHLDEARSGADDDLAADIDNADAVASYQRQVATYNAQWAELGHCLDTFGSLTASERWSDANDHVADCVSIVDDLERTLDEVESAVADIDQDRLSEDERLDLADIEDDLQYEADTLPVVAEFADSLDLFADGMPTIMTAFEDYEDEQWRSAQTGFEDARDTFARSDGRLADIESDPNLPTDVASDIVDMRCNVGALHEGADYWVKSAAAANRGDWSDADSYAQDGNDAFDQC